LTETSLLVTFTSSQLGQLTLFSWTSLLSERMLSSLKSLANS